MVADGSGGSILKVQFDSKKTFNASAGTSVDDEGNKLQEQTNNISVAACKGGAGIDAQYDYTTMGETWSTPKIIRMPTSADGNLESDRYVAVMGGGMGSADQCAGSPCHGAELISIAAIGDDNGQVRHAELASHLIESLLTPTGNRPIQLSVLGCKVLCDQLACETRCAVKHDLKLPLRHHEISRCSQASTVASLLHVTGSLAWYLFAGK